ncbi:MAG: 4-(cytidine 5'-diphospho)-2-C-methyl-D-erythritol kinase [Candidatus Aureabacteria bacterium]|nr:4-(cytidine 5'-diphospho)-2-C-methyl-D-erythritol kinase [Candidatus Auribacterota bacterium]
MNSPLTVRCPAKINLYLDVRGRRPDGYHEICTVMQTVDVCDELLIEARDSEISMACDSALLPADPANLVWRAAELLRRETRVCGGAHLGLMKRIPVAAGLGGGSSDAAGALRGLNLLWRLNLYDAALESMAARVGSDVPFFIRGGTALCTGRGEKIAPIPPAASYPIVIVTPPILVSTPAVYASLLPEPSPPPSRATEFLAALASGDPALLAAKLYNRLEANTGAHMGEVEKIKRTLLAAGALGASMSGSGPSVFGIAGDLGRAKRIARAIRPSLPPGSFIHCGMTAAPAYTAPDNQL